MVEDQIKNSTESPLMEQVLYEIKKVIGSPKGTVHGGAVVDWGQSAPNKTAFLRTWSAAGKSAKEMPVG